MRRPDRGAVIIFGCFVTLASIRCGQGDSLSERDSPTLTIHVPDQDEVDRHMQGLWQIFSKEIPVTYLHPRLFYVAAHRRVKGMQNRRNIFSNVESLWIEDETIADSSP